MHKISCVYLTSRAFSSLNGSNKGEMASFSQGEVSLSPAKLLGVYFS